MPEHLLTKGRGEVTKGIRRPVGVTRELVPRERSRSLHPRSASGLLQRTGIKDGAGRGKDSLAG